MTIEHKILKLIDRGIIHLTDVCDLVGRGAKKEVHVLLKQGKTKHSNGGEKGYLSLTSDGVERLNVLDAGAA